MNEVQETHARQALKDIYDAAKQAKGKRADDLGRFCGELMAKVSGILEFDFVEHYPPMSLKNGDELNVTFTVPLE